MKPRVVYDNNVLFQAFVSPGGFGFRCLQFVEEKRVELFRSRASMRELADVLARVLLDPEFPQIATEGQVARFLRRIHALSRPVRNVPLAFHLLRDPKDEPILNLAIAAKATRLVTWNKRHLGYLMKRDTPEGRDFCKRFRRLIIVDPRPIPGRNGYSDRATRATLRGQEQVALTQPRTMREQHDVLSCRTTRTNRLKVSADPDTNPDRSGRRSTIMLGASPAEPVRDGRCCAPRPMLAWAAVYDGSPSRMNAAQK